MNKVHYSATCASQKNINGSGSWKRLLTHAGAADALFVSGTVVVSSAAKVTHTILTREAR